MKTKNELFIENIENQYTQLAIVISIIAVISLFQDIGLDISFNELVNEHKGIADQLIAEKLNLT